MATNKEQVQRDEEAEVQPLDPFLRFEGFPEVRKMILASLPVPDLLRCRLVSQSWRHSATTALKSTRKCFAYLTHTCKNFRKLDGFLQSMDICFISALHIQVPDDHSGCYNFFRFGLKAARAKCENLKNLPLRSLRLCLNTCHASERIMIEILLGAAETLQELTLDYGGYPCMHLRFDESKGLSLPKLERITIHPRYIDALLELHFLIGMAPNLKTVNGLPTLFGLKTYESVRLDVLTEICIMPLGNVGDPFEALVQAKPKLLELQIYDKYREEFVPKSWFDHPWTLLNQCAQTLKRLSICAIKFAKLQRKGNFRLEALESLTLFLPRYAESVGEIEDTAANLNLNLCCPALKSLRFSIEEDYCYHKVPYSFRGMYDEYNPRSPVQSVREITLKSTNCTPAIMNTCISVFPMITSFAYEHVNCYGCLRPDWDHFDEMHRIWIEISTLEKLKIGLVEPSCTPRTTMDSLFCGISFDEAIEIKEQLDRGELVNLETFSYCPDRPSLLYAQNLKEVTLVFSPNFELISYFPITELTACLVYGRRPGLKLRVELHRSGIEHKLRCVEKFAEIITIEGKGSSDWW